MRKENKIIAYVLGNLVSVIIVFIATQMPEILLKNNYFDSGLVGYDLVRYAMLCIAWIVFLVFLATRIVSVIKYINKDQF